MPTHDVDHWFDGTLKQYFCKVCGEDNPTLSSNCPGPKKEFEINVGKKEETGTKPA